MTKTIDYFGSLVFDERQMKAKLPADVFEALKKTINENVPIDTKIADNVAKAMKEWALEKGATHYAHWTQPLNGTTAEKHEGFIKPMLDGNVIMEFTGKELLRGERDGSSFPNGGIRHTSFARAYTTWDPTSYAFIKDRTLCIPAVICSYSGEALDNKIPLLRSANVLNREALRVLKILGRTDVKSVRTMAGPEQEYFLVDKKVFEKRPDLKYCGRTLFGAKAPRGHQLDDHYYGALQPRVSAFMAELNESLWKMGILAKTEHNEVPPAGHEMAPIYTFTNLATDQNMLTMEIMQKVALKHGLVCLLSEKPLSGINGNGKHNNWSIATDGGENLLEPGESPYSNIQFMLFLSAVIKAVDEYQDLLRISVAYAGNDHRLGAHEAPPAIVSVFLGTDLQNVVDTWISGDSYAEPEEKIMDLGIPVIAKFKKDNTDRNRTSPFAFTGNKFEFRMPGSSQNLALVNAMLNTVVAESLKEFADAMEGKSGAELDSAIRKLIKDTLTAHSRIIFNGNGYSERWVKEAEKRGLLNLRTTPECWQYMLDNKNSDMLKRLGIFTERELISRHDIGLDTYIKTVTIEAETAYMMATSMIIPAILAYSSELARSIADKKAVGLDREEMAETALVKKLSVCAKELSESAEILKAHIAKSSSIENLQGKAGYCRDYMISEMEKIKSVSDEAEIITSKEYWPLPDYGEIMYSERF